MLLSLIIRTCFDQIKTKICPYCRKKDISLKNESHNFERMFVKNEFQETKCKNAKMEQLIKEEINLKNESNNNFETIMIKNEFQETKIENLIKSFTGLELLEKGKSLA